MSKKIYSYFLIFIGLNVFSQTYKITYKTFFEGKERENQDPILVFSNLENTFILTEKIVTGNKEIPFEVQKISRSNNNVSQFAFLKNDVISEYSDNQTLLKQKFELKTDTKEILGYRCKKAETIINSNKIEVWYTQDLKIKGSPSILGQDLGLVLEIIRNGNSATKAQKIEKIKKFDFDSFLKSKKIVSNDELSHKDLLWKSRFNTITIFEDEIINFSDDSKSDDKILRFAKGTIILKKVKFPEITDSNNIFIQLTEESNGDAYDRTGSVFLIPADKENTFFNALSKGIKNVPYFENGNGKTYQGIVKNDDYEPVMELMRFFTPFGIQKYNYNALKNKNWHDKVYYRQEITDFQNILSGKEFWIGTFIGNYDKGGHKISMEITIHNDGVNLFKNNRVIPLFNSLNIMEMAGQEYATLFNSEKGLIVNFTLEKNLKNAQLRYITTGHGGWENGDEFVPKENKILLNGKTIFNFIPWRTDCGSYRLYNPVSGNFANGLSSSDYSRSNWCPGTTTNPNYISLGDLPAGKYQMQILIPQGKNEGSSFSYWNVSGILLGEE